ncbi:MAG: SHOCT domain-containing protein [Verrucomicrobia bacterium]|nr:SHOCT domain-containing protein [Verrucomicrobiota bacterium]
MKTKLLFAMAMLAACLAGCVSTADKLNNIKIGMTRGQVVALLGEPNSMSAQGNIEYLTYYLANEAVSRDQPYAVRLVDGKVESFGRFIQLADIYNRPVNGNPPTNPWGTAPMMMPAMAPASAPDIVTQLQQLKALKDQGVLNEEEFQKAKARVLAAK